MLSIIVKFDIYYVFQQTDNLKASDMNHKKVIKRQTRTTSEY